MNIVEIWSRCPLVNYPTLDHHLLHVFVGVAVFLIFMVYFKTPDFIAALVTFALAFMEELISVLYLSETVRNALNDLVQYAFVFVAYFLFLKNWIAAGITAGGLLALYFLLTVKIL